MEIENNDKYIKKIKRTGITAIVYGIAILAFLIFSFIFLEVTNPIGFWTMLLISIIFITIGIKIKKEIQNSKHNWFTILIGLTIIMLVLNFLNGGAVGLLNIIFLAIFFEGFTAFKKLLTPSA